MSLQLSAACMPLKLVTPIQQRWAPSLHLATTANSPVFQLLNFVTSHSQPQFSDPFSLLVQDSEALLQPACLYLWINVSYSIGQKTLKL